MTDAFAVFAQRYQQGEWRTPIFRDMLVTELRRFSRPPTLLDIGCGAGFDDDPGIQRQLAASAGRYIGVEPDPEVELGPHFTEAHRCLFEEAPISAGSVDLAFCVMVLEHVRHPDRFWSKLSTVLADGGVFWGFTVDSRHWFSWSSLWLKRLRLKDFYLNRLHGERGVDRYHNYPVYYRANSPRQILPFMGPLLRCDFFSFSRVGQVDYYLPRMLRPVSTLIDRGIMARNGPGAILAVRVEKAPAP